MNGKKRDPNKVLRGIKHGRGGYLKGCGCYKCTTDESRYQRYFRERQKGVTTLSFEKWKLEEGFAEGDSDESPGATVTRLHAVAGAVDEDSDEMSEVREAAKRKSRGQPGGKAKEPGEIEQAVIDECSGLSMASDRPAMVAAAKNMARILDNPKQAALHATANRQMTSILNDLRGASKRKTKGRLAAVQKMTKAVGS